MTNNIQISIYYLPHPCDIAWASYFILQVHQAECFHFLSNSTCCYGLKGAAWNTIKNIFFRSEIKHALWKHHLDNISLHAGWKVNFVQDGYVELHWGSLMRHGCSLNPIPSPRELLFSISSPSTNRSVPQTMIKMVQTDHRFVDTDSSKRQCWWGFCYWHAGLAHHSDVDLWTHQKNLEKMPAINNLDGFRIFF